MKSLTEHLWFEVPQRRGYLNITGNVEELVLKSGVQEGLCLVNAMHITAPSLMHDAELSLLLVLQSGSSIAVTRAGRVWLATKVDV